MDKKLGFFLFPRTRSKRGKIQRDRSFLQNGKKNYPDNFHEISNMFICHVSFQQFFIHSTLFEQTLCIHRNLSETTNQIFVQEILFTANSTTPCLIAIIRKNTKSLDNFHRMGRKKVGKERRESSRKLFVPRNVRPITRLRANACTHLGPSNGILSPRFAYSRYTFQPRFPERFSWEKTLSLSHAHGRGRGGEREGALLKKSFTSRYLAEVLTACRIECNHGW